MTPKLSELEILLLDRAGAANPLSIAYGTASEYLATPATTDAVLRQVRSAMLHLFDLSLIAFFRAPARSGYGKKWQDVAVAMSREEIETEFDLDQAEGVIEDERDMVFFVETPRGREVFSELPQDSLPRLKP